MINGWFVDMRDYYQDREYAEQAARRSKWDTAVSNAAGALDDLSKSRSKANFDAALKKFDDLYSALFEMLDLAFVNDLQAAVPVAGSITFSSGAYGYPPDEFKYPPSHWVPYARAAYMKTVAGAPIQYADDRDNLKRRIFDPGFYLDLVPITVSYFTWLLIAIEPAFRATGYERKRLTEISGKLKDFVGAWRQSLFVTNIDPFLLPPYDAGYSYVRHPFALETMPLHARGIPLGVVDPVSGFAAFVPVWNEGFEFGLGNMVMNAAFVRAKAKEALDDAVKGIEPACGIGALGLVHAKLEELTLYGLDGSMFSRIEPVKRTPGHTSTLREPHAAGEPHPPPLTAGTPHSPFHQLRERHVLGIPETIDLGDIGAKAGKPGKKYKAWRVYDPNIVTFRIPIVRRMDASGIQLGYRLEVGTGSLNLNSHSASLVLTKFDAVAIPADDDGNLQRFPAAPLSVDLITDDGVHFDVVQSVPFTAEDEERFDRGEFDPAHQRLFVNPRTGRVAVRFYVTFAIDLANPDHQYFGYANVAIVNLDESARNGFILSVNVFEEANLAYQTYSPGEIHEEHKEIAGGSAVIHMVPSYLVAEEDYFKDRLAGLLVLDKSIIDIRQTVDMIPKPWEGDGNPMWRIRDLAYAEAEKLKKFGEFERKNPDLAAAAVSRFQPLLVIDERR